MTQTATLSRPPIPAGDYVLDPSHTHVGFVGRHLMVSKVRGAFEKAEGRVRVGETLADFSFEVTVDVASVATRDEKRDGHLRSADFFDVERFPQLTFRSTRIEPAADNRYAITGDLTIRDQTHPVTLDVEYLGAQKTPWELRAPGSPHQPRSTASSGGSPGTSPSSSGGWLVSRKIQLEIEAEVVAAPPAA